MIEHSWLLGEGAPTGTEMLHGVPGGDDGAEMQLPCQAAFPRSNPNGPAVRGEKVMGQVRHGI